MDSTSEDTGQGKSRWPAFLTTRFVIIVASLVVLAIVGTVTASVQAKNDAAAAAADRKAAQAVTDFDNAATACERADTALSTAVADATTTATTDPSSLEDPTLLDALKAASTKNSGIPPCATPAMAADTDAINAQTATLHSATDGVSTAAVSLENAVDAVAASVQAKVDAVAASVQAKVDAVAASAQAKKDAAAAAAAAAAQSQRTWHYTSDDGHTFDLVLSAGSPETDDSWQYPPEGSDSCGLLTTSCETAKLVDVCPDFDSSTMIAIPVTATYTATTQGFSTLIPMQHRTLTLGNYKGPNSSMGNYLNDYVEIGHVWSSGPDCTTPDSDNGGFSDDVKTGESRTEKFVVILKKWKTPNTPSGDHALLDWVAISPYPLTLNSGAYWQPDSTKSLTLSNNIVGG